MDMSGIVRPFGLAPWENNEDRIRCHLYAVATNPTDGVYLGSMVKSEGTSLSTPFNGNLLSVGIATAGAAGSIVGGVIGVFDSNMFPVSHIAAAEVGNGVIAGYALVCDNPYQRYIAQEDGDGASIIAANIGLNADLVGVTGDDVTGVSKQALDSSSVATTATLAVKIVGVHPEDTLSTDGVAGNYCRFIVMINAAAMAPNVVGA